MMLMLCKCATVLTLRHQHFDSYMFFIDCTGDTSDHTRDHTSAHDHTSARDHTSDHTGDHIKSARDHTNDHTCR